jgi:hypothetical protein
MKFSVAAILALGVAPAYSLSYLESISGTAAPSISGPFPVAVEPPFFFTNGAKDEPAESPSFFFTNGSTDEPAASSTGSYLENLGGSSSVAPSAPSGAAGSSSSYLDALAGPSTSMSGAGMTSYLDALPKSAPSSGPGLHSYAASLNQAAASSSAPVAAAPAAAATSSAPAAAAPATPYIPAESSGPVAAGANYLAALASSTTSGSPTGGGLVGYLDALTRIASPLAGAGIRTHTDLLPVTNTFAGTGAGTMTYTDALGGGRVTSGKSFAPLGASKGSPAPAFAMGSTTGKFDFSFVVDAELMEKLKNAGGRRVKLTGKVTSFN